MSRRNTSLGVAIGVALIILLVSAASVLAVSNRSERLLKDVEQSSDINDALLTNQTVDSSLALLLFVSAAADQGVISSEQLFELQNTTHESVEELRRRLSILEMQDQELFTSLLRAVEEPTGDRFQEAHKLLTRNEATLNVTRSVLAGRMSAASDQQNRVAQVASFAVAFLVPLSFMVVYRFAARRRARTARLQAELRRQVEVSTAKNELIGSLSHELRTPLTSIYGLAGAVDESPDDLAFMREMNGLILSEAAELDRMVTDLLTAAKADSDGLRFTPGSTDVASELAAVVTPLVRQGTELTVTVEDGLMAWVDRFRFRHLLRNLVSNAAAHGSAPITVTAVGRGGRVSVEVVDNGDGVPPDIEARMFERFVHTGHDSLVAGSVGIGLSIARVLADGMNGTVTYERRDDTTVLRVDLPAEVSAADQLIEA